MIKSYKKQISKSSLSAKIILLFVVIFTFFFIAIASGIFYSYNMQQNFEKVTNLHIKPLKELNEISQIYDINILDTVNEMAQGNISYENGKEVLELSKNLLLKSWKKFKSNQTNKNKFIQEEIAINKITSLLDQLILSIEINDKKTIDEIIRKKLHPALINSSYYLEDLFVNEINIIDNFVEQKEKKLNDDLKLFIPSGILFLLIFFFFIRVILLKINANTIELEKSKKQIEMQNLVLEEKVKERTIDLEEQTIKAQAATKAKSYFLANMSHEIRTPMNGILGMSHLILNTNLDDKQKNYIKKIHKSATLLLGIINDILDISKIESGKLQLEKTRFNLFKTVEDVINLIEIKTIEKNIDLIVGYDPQIGKYYIGDSLKLNQVLTNLLSNAVKFTHEGEISLLVKVTKENKIRFEVSDTGIGLSKDQIDKIFDSFTQADLTTAKKFGGTGLGLSITKQLVELMNGEVFVESELGVGSKFIFEIELQKDKGAIPYTIFKGKKVLIVDDCESWLSVLDTLMHSFGFDVKLVKSGKKAIDILRKSKDDFDLILVDWNMPELNGIETCKIIEEQIGINAKKIILISAHDEEDISNQMNQIKLTYFLHKPINPSDLNDMLSEIFITKSNIKKISQRYEKDDLNKKISKLKENTILLVEDNEINQEIIIDLLAKTKLTIDIANDGLEAIKKFNEKEYTLILMDIQMPNMDGYEATQEIRKIDKKVPIIALTANAMKEDVEKTIKVGMNKHLNKPIEVEKLYKTLIEFLEKDDDEDFLILDETPNIEIPEFENLDKDYALKLIMGMKSTFIQIIKGLLKYKDFNFEELEGEEFIRTMHSIKGLSASAGALEISEKAKVLEKTQNKELLPEFIKDLNLLITEIEEKLEIINPSVEKEKTITKEKRDELFSSLKSAIETKRAKVCKPIIEEIEHYILEEGDAKLFEEIKAYTSKFKFKEALKLLEDN